MEEFERHIFDLKCFLKSRGMRVRMHNAAFEAERLICEQDEEIKRLTAALEGRPPSA